MGRVQVEPINLLSAQTDLSSHPYWPHHSKSGLNGPFGQQPGLDFASYGPIIHPLGPNMVHGSMNAKTACGAILTFFIMQFDG